MNRLLEHVIFEGEKIKGSRFIVNIYPIKKADESKKIVDDLRKAFVGANHHCYALRMSDGEIRTSDDGEPRGSAGAPILRRIESMEAVDLMVVVTRYFGGTKLGIGGLVRAYGGAAYQGLVVARFARFVEKASLSFVYSYSDSSHVEAVLRDVEIESMEYGATVSARISLPLKEVYSFRKALDDRTSGRVEWKE